MAEDEVVGWHHQFNGQRIEQALGDGEGQGGLVCLASMDATEQLNNNCAMYGQASLS